MDEKVARTQWHPAFVSAMRVEFQENAADLEFKDEYNLTKKPLELDLVVIRKNPGAVIKNEIGAFFETHNIFEYKSPDDTLNLETFYKVLAYASLYRVENAERDAKGKPVRRRADDITVTMVRHGKPARFMKDLEEMELRPERVSPGIYRIGRIAGFKMQIVVSRELSPEQHNWLVSLQRKVTYDNLDRAFEAILSAEDAVFRDTMKDI
ncbi:MAG: hypothetical protein IKN79_08680, partial [Eubacterium sp.]|nr:hypothetical protein [Eubacterium sp.]